MRDLQTAKNQGNTHSLPLLLQVCLRLPQCDEDKPKCSNCSRYNAECIYPTPSCDNQLDHATNSRPTTSSPIQTPKSILKEVPISLCPNEFRDVSIRDLALMHQWSTCTSHGFGDGFPGASKPWCIDVPILAQDYPFLMRGILAVTALHMSRLTTDETLSYEYIQLAACHQDHALPAYRAALADVTEQSVHAVLAFSTLIMVYSIAAPKGPSTMFATGAPEWVFLHRGVGDIPPQWQYWINAGPLHSQMHRRRLQPIEPTFNPDDSRLLALHTILFSFSHYEQSDTIHYEETLYWLRQAFAHTFCPASGLGSKYAVFYWIEHVPQGYFDLLRLHKPYALILLAHCCILIQRVAGSWYLDGFAKHVLHELKPLLSNEYLPWIEWPLEACGII